LNYKGQIQARSKKKGKIQGKPELLSLGKERENRIRNRQEARTKIPSKRRVLSSQKTHEHPSKKKARKKEVWC